MLTFLPRDTTFSTIPISHVDKMHDTSFGVFIFDSRTDDLESYLKNIAGRKVRMSLLLFTNLEEDDNYYKVLGNLEKMREPSYFYLVNVAPRSGNMVWYRALATSSGTIIDRLSFADNTLRVNESFNMKGLVVTSTALSWPPFYTIDNCNPDGLECATSYGYLKDYMDVLSRRFNFTYSSHKNMDDNWGVVPNANGTYEGVLGDLFSKKYDMIICVWYWLMERDKFADHVPIVRYRDVLAMKEGNSRTDFSLFLRVFTNDSWAIILFVAIVISACLLLFKSCSPKKYTKGHSVILLTLLIFFVVIRAYYGGALTKFFTVTTPEPFENKIDVIKAYPKYNLMIKKAYEGVYYSLMRNGDLVYTEFWRRLTENPDDTTYTSEKDGMELIRSDPKNVIFNDEPNLLGYLKSNTNEQIPYMFAHGRWDFYTLMLHKNSPLSPMFKHGAKVLREKGIEQQLYLKWIGVSEQDNSATLNAVVLTPGQVILIFSLMMVVYGVSLVLFCGELVASKTGNMRGFLPR